MANIVVCSLGFRGHLNPLLAVAKSLVSLGHTINFFCTETYAKDIQNIGAIFHAYQSIFDAKFEMPKTNLVSLYLIRSVTEAHQVLPQMMSIIDDNQVDLVIYEGACLAGRLLSQLLDVPAVKLCPSFATTENYNPFSAGRQEFFDNPAMVKLFDEEVAKLKKDFNVEYELKENIGHAEKLNIVCMPRVFQHCNDLFDERFKFIGPAFIEEINEAYHQINKPLLYISLGTLLNNQPAFYQKCLEAFGNSDWQVVMPVGDKIDTSNWEIPDNFQIASYVPQDAILKSATAFITVGGMNSVQQALFYGVPVVVIPATGEHKLIAQRVNELGVGIILDKESVTVQCLKRAVDELVSSANYRERCHAYSKLSTAAGGVELAASEIEQYLHR